MNILIFCSNPVNGGTAKMFYEMTSALQQNKEGHKVTGCVDMRNEVEVYRKIADLKRVNALSEDNVCRGLYGGGTAVRVAQRILRKARYSRTIRRNIASMRKLLREEHIDCVIIHNGGYIGDELCNQMLEASYQENIPKRIYILHNCTTERIIFPARFLPYDKKVSREATDLVTVSEFTKNRIMELSHITKAIKVIPNGLPDRAVNHAEAGKKMIRPDPQKKNVLMIGNFLANKGQMELLRAAELMRHIPEVHFTIIGNVYDRPYYDKCRAYMTENGLDGLVEIIHGIHNASDYVQLYDVMAVPSMSSESFGLISVEAMMNGVPVVAFRCGGIPEVVEDGRDGYIVETGDCRGMAVRLEELLTHEEVRIKMSSWCRLDYKKKFSVGVMIESYKSVIGIE